MIDLLLFIESCICEDMLTTVLSKKCKNAENKKTLDHIMRSSLQQVINRLKYKYLTKYKLPNSFTHVQPVVKIHSDLLKVHLLLIIVTVCFSVDKNTLKVQQ